MLSSALHRRTRTAPADAHGIGGRTRHRRTRTAPADAHGTGGRALHRLTRAAHCKARGRGRGRERVTVTERRRDVPSQLCNLVGAGAHAGGRAGHAQRGRALKVFACRQADMLEGAQGGQGELPRVQLGDSTLQNSLGPAH